MASSLGALVDVGSAAPSLIDAELHYLVALTYLESAHKLWKWADPSGHERWDALLNRPTPCTRDVRANPSQIDAELHYLVALTYLESAHQLWKWADPSGHERWDALLNRPNPCTCDG